MAKRKRYKKTSKCPEPINTLLDIAGAATLGMYVKHKVKRDFENGCGEESAKAAAAVFGIGSMRRGSQGLINLGGLMGLNSSLKDIDNQNASRNAMNTSQFISPVEKKPDILRPAKAGLWRDCCEDGTAYGISPNDYDTADDYADALCKAKQRVSNREKNNSDITPLNDLVNPKLGNQYRWRRHCEDGSKYGVNPEDYESADDYEEALNEAKKSS